MSNINLNNVALIATTPLFENLTLNMGPGDRVGIIAGNGGGKTSLFNCIAGRNEVSSGEITGSRGLRVGYVEQGVSQSLTNLSLRQAVCEALAPEMREGESWRAEVALDGFETPEELRQRPVHSLSGGWQRLMLIARVWVNDPDALLLDEPTNHLDLRKILLLESWLFSNTDSIPVMIASHDRAFLDATTNRTLFLRPGKSLFFAVGYSHARVALEEADLAAQRQVGRDRKEVQRLRRNAAKLTNIGINSGSDLLRVKARQLKERAKKIEASAQTLHKDQSGDIRLSNRGTHAKVLIGFEDVGVTAPDGQTLFSTGKFHLFQGDKIVVLGENGSGKSQFVKLLHGAISQPGSVEGIQVTPSLVSGYIDQDLSELAQFSTPGDALGEFNIGDGRARALLVDAGFAIEKQSKPLSQLSFGQRSRLGLLILRLKEPNFYLLDEPTNHVDIPAQEKLEEEILLHGASTILVSHDRRFVRNIGTRFFQIKRKKLIEVDGPEAFFSGLQSG